MQDKPGAVAQNSTTLINLGRSKRLAAMRQSQQRPENSLSSTRQKSVVNKRDFEIQEARELIAQRMLKIKSSYSPGMQNKLFVLRYGTEQKMSQLNLQQLYTLLCMPQKLSKEIKEVGYQENI
ncbi:hypothetical protein [Methyloprofundus sp.]|uniref:hypothetical protein n=1 Tax=Methyloprofundus sp. TaxID=2020875 RepID=UPI003D0E156B